MELSDCGGVIIFGGSFDPPHAAHVKLPMMVREKVGADAVAYVPAARAPHKLGVEQTPAEHRLAMLRLALRNEPRAIILTDELDRAADGRPSYTVDTLEALRGRLADGVTLRLLIGADQVRIFDTWRSPQRIVALAEPVVMHRPGEPLPDDPTWRARVVEVPRMDVSSTEVRRRVADGESVEGLLDPEVARYVDEHRLYGAFPTR